MSFNPIYPGNRFSNNFTHSNLESSASKPSSSSTEHRPSSPTTGVSATAERSALPNPVFALRNIARLLRTDKEAQALEQLKTLPEKVQGDLFGQLWCVRGKPSFDHSDPKMREIAHSDFGRVSFLNLDPRCASTPALKALAIEMYLPLFSIDEMIDAFQKSDEGKALNIFNSLPEKIQNEIYGKHWKITGMPTQDHVDESLRKIAHSDFGKVSFLGTEPRCQVPYAKKAETLSNYSTDYKAKIDIGQQLVDKFNIEWPKIDNANIPGMEKNHQKKEIIYQLAEKLVPLFEQKPYQKLQPDRQSEHALAESYILAYPSLKPFIFQLLPNLRISSDCPGEALSSSVPDTSISNSGLDVSAQKDYRKAVWEETHKDAVNGFYYNSRGDEKILNWTHALYNIQLCDPGKISGKRPGSCTTKIYVQKGDCLYTAEKLAARGLNPLVLDAASRGHFGGGYASGASAQEEDLCRRSCLAEAVDPKLVFQEKNFYPLNPHNGIYVPKVPVFRAGYDQKYAKLDKPFEVAVGIVAAHRKPALDRSVSPAQLTQEPAADTTKMIRTLLQMAYQNGHKSVVLVPLGCGAFENPPDHICKLFLNEIQTNFPNCFEEIVFSIIDDHNTGKAHNPEGNFKPFAKQVLGIGGKVFDQDGSEMTTI